MLYRTIFILAGSFLPILLYAQETEVKMVVDQLFKAMHTQDSTLARSLFVDDPHLYTSFTDPSGSPKLAEDDLEQFLGFVGSEHDFSFEEKLWDYQIHVDDNLATVSTPYTFYLNEEVRHCGVNFFNLTRTDEGWKIYVLADTRRRTGCQTSEDP